MHDDTTAAVTDQNRKEFGRSAPHHDGNNSSDMDQRQKRKSSLYRVNSVQEERFVQLEKKIMEEILWNINVKRELELMRKMVEIYIHLRGSTEWL